MSKVNTILEGRCKGYGISIDKNGISICGDYLTKKSIASYNVIDETNKGRYSFWKGALGTALLGNFGVVAGIDGKNTKEYLIEIEWIYPKNSTNNKSLILLDERYYQTLVRSMF